MNNEQGGVDHQDMPIKWQIVVLMTFMAAVLASHFLDSYMAGAYQGGVFVDWSWRYMLFAAIVTFTAFPIAYQKARENKDAPTLVQIGMVFLTGMGWDKLLSAVHYAARQ